MQEEAVGITFYGYVATGSTSTTSGTAWMASYPPSRFIAIVYNTPAASLSSTLATTGTDGCGGPPDDLCRGAVGASN